LNAKKKRKKGKKEKRRKRKKENIISMLISDIRFPSWNKVGMLTAVIMKWNQYTHS